MLFLYFHVVHMDHQLVRMLTSCLGHVALLFLAQHHVCSHRVHIQ